MNSGSLRSILLRESPCFIIALRTGSMAHDSLPSTLSSRISFPFFFLWFLSFADCPWNAVRAWKLAGREELFHNNSFCARKLMHTYFRFMIQLHLWQRNKGCLHSWVFMNGNIYHAEQLVIFAKWWTAVSDPSHFTLMLLKVYFYFLHGNIVFFVFLLFLSVILDLHNYTSIFSPLGSRDIQPSVVCIYIPTNCICFVFTQMTVVEITISIVIVIIYHLISYAIWLVT